MGQLLISPILDLAECNIYGVDVIESFSGPKKGVEWLRFFASPRVLEPLLLKPFMLKK